MESKVCVFCGKSFIPKQKTQIYCSEICGDRYRRKKARDEYAKRKPKKICPVCGKKFQGTRERITYCSDECKKIGKHEVYLKCQREMRRYYQQKVSCPICGKKFYRTRVLHKYCSDECREKAMNFASVDPLEYSVVDKEKEIGHLDRTIKKLRSEGKWYADYQKAQTPAKVDVWEVMKDIHEPCQKCSYKKTCMCECKELRVYLERSKHE